MSSVNYTDAEILQFMLENANMDVDTIKHEMQMKEREKYLNMHPYKIWKGANGNYYTYFPSDENSEDRIRKQRANRKDLEDLIVKFWKDKEETITVEDVFTEWNERRARLGQIQLATHDRNIRVFNRHFSDFGQRDIKKITPLDINDFLEEELADKHLRAKAFSNLRAVVKGIFLRAKRRGLIDFSINQVLMDLDISDSSFNQEREDDEDQIFNEKQLAVLASYLKEHPDIWNLGIMLILVTGVRVGELVALKWSDFTDNSYRYFKVQRTETTYKGDDGKIVHGVKAPKTKAGYRMVTIPDDCVWIIKELRKINPFTEYVFTRNGHRMTTATIRNRLYRICDKLGLKRKSPHKGRKTYASILLDHGADEAFVTAQLGHTDIACTEAFYHKDRKSNATKSAIVSGIPEFEIFAK